MKCAAVSVCRLADNAETQDFTVTSLLICFLISAIKAVVSSDVLISGLCLGVDLLCVGTCAASVCRLVPLSLKTAQPLSFRLCLRFPSGAPVPSVRAARLLPSRTQPFLLFGYSSTYICPAA